MPAEPGRCPDHAARRYVRWPNVISAMLRLACSSMIWPYAFKPEPAIDPVEQRRARLALEAGQGTRQRRLADCQFCGGIGDVFGLGEHDEPAQFLEVHCSTITAEHERQRRRYTAHIPHHEGLQSAILRAFDGLLRSLQPEPLGSDRFRARSEANRFGRVFGGQMVAQAMRAAAVTVDDKPPHSLHAYFVKSGSPDEPLDLSVDRVRDGRSMAARRVTVAQAGDALLIAMVSFHDNPAEPEFAGPAPTGADPEAAATPAGLGAKHAAGTPRQSTNLDQPAAAAGHPHRRTDVFLRSGARAGGPRSHWMRLPRTIEDDPVLHSVLLAYSSDYLLLDMALRSHPDPVDVESSTAFSLDHRCGCTGRCGSTDGIATQRNWWRFRVTEDWFAAPSTTSTAHLVASTAQEVLVRAKT